MKKLLFAACGAFVLLAPAAQAQGVYVGPGGVEIDRGPRMDERRWDRRRHWDEERTGTVYERRSDDRRCRVVTIQRENEDGDLVTRRVRRCD